MAIVICNSFAGTAIELDIDLTSMTSLVQSFASADQLFEEETPLTSRFVMVSTKEGE